MKSLCELILVDYPKSSDVGNLYATCIANCVFNSFLSYTAIMLNIVTIHAIRKTSLFPCTSKTLLLSLSVSDVGVGLFVQPLYSSLLVKWIQQIIPNCNTYKAFSIIGILFGTDRFGTDRCRQVLGYSSSSQIPGTCDSQACCCCGDLNMGVEYVSFFNYVVDSVQ